FQILGVADVAMDEGDPGLAQARQRQLAAPASKVVKGDDRDGGRSSEHRGQVRSNEPGPAGYQDPHPSPFAPPACSWGVQYRSSHFALCSGSPRAADACVGSPLIRGGTVALRLI